MKRPPAFGSSQKARGALNRPTLAPHNRRPSKTRPDLGNQSASAPAHAEFAFLCLFREKEGLTPEERREMRQVFEHQCKAPTEAGGLGRFGAVRGEVLGAILGSQSAAKPSFFFWRGVPCIKRSFTISLCHQPFSEEFELLDLLQRHMSFPQRAPSRPTSTNTKDQLVLRL